VRKFEPHPGGPRRAPERIETCSFELGNATDAQVYLDGGIQPIAVTGRTQARLVMRTMAGVVATGPVDGVRGWSLLGQGSP
jgi:hypothetical protein